MTFSLVARDPETGSFGMVVSSSSPAVASRCMHLRAGVGAVASQNVTNPALGPAVLDALAGGEDATEALSKVLSTEDHAAYRQVTVVDSRGITALHSGPNALGIHTDIEGDQAVAAGNMLATPEVPTKVLYGYLESTADTFEGRLLDGLKAGLAEGGEAGPVRSAGLGVVDDVPWLTTDLRVDDHDDPIGELERLLGIWMPQKADYRTRGIDPTDAPSYGVPGDE